MEFDDISSIDEASDGYEATVHGVITSVSPMKGQSYKKYFDGYVTDGQKKLRFVGFSPEKAKQLDDFANDKQSVVLKKCCIKNVRSGNQLEILVGDYTDISKSAKIYTLKLVH